METMECIHNRRSIRRFMQDPIPDDMLLKLLDAVRWAPSWANTQCWEVIVVREDETKKQLADLLSANNPAAQGIKEAPVVFIVCGKTGSSGFKSGEQQTDKGDWYMFDLGIASQNLCLAAHDLGLGTVHVGNINHSAIDKLLGLPDHIKSVEIIPVGYPAKEAKAPPRKALEEFVHLEKFGGKMQTE